MRLAIRSLALAALAAAPLLAASDFVPIFNGKDLSGWNGDPAFWSVRDGAITGQTTAENPAATNTFLVWDEGSPANFELRLSFKLSAQNDKGFANSGIQPTTSSSAATRPISTWPANTSVCSTRSAGAASS